MKKSALITGIAGQDGSYLAELLLKQGYEVHGIVRPGTDHKKLWRIAGVLPRTRLHEADFTSEASLSGVLRAAAPSELYHLASKVEAQFSSTEISDDELQALRTMIETMREDLPTTKLLYASSAKVFGIPVVSPQDERTPYAPISAYGRTKAEGMRIVGAARDQGLFAASAVLFPHESPRRDPIFLARKVTRGAARIKVGLEKELRLGDLNAQRDWGFAGDYVRAMWQMTQLPRPEDFVIGTGVIHTVRDILDIAFGELGLPWQNVVVIDKAFLAPKEPAPIVANPAKARAELRWQPEVSFEELICEMTREDLRLVEQEPHEIV